MGELISVIVPVYNAEKYLDKCITSIRNQAYKNIEIILIDDGSTDSSGRICDKYSLLDKRISVYHIANGGVSNARNLGIQKSCGEYLMFVDSDDYIESEMVGTHLLSTLQSDADLCVSALSNKCLGHEFTLNLSNVNKDKLLFLLQSNVLFGPVVKMYKRNVIVQNQIQFPPDFSYGEDLIFNIHYLSCINKIHYINYCFYNYVTDNIQSLSRKTRWNMFDNDMKLQKILRDWLENSKLIFTETERILADRTLGIANNSIALTFKRNWPLGNLEKIPYIRKILWNDDVVWSLSRANVAPYAKWIIWAMTHKCTLLFYIASLIKRGK